MSWLYKIIQEEGNRVGFLVERDLDVIDCGVFWWEAQSSTHIFPLLRTEYCCESNHNLANAF